VSSRRPTLGFIQISNRRRACQSCTQTQTLQNRHRNNAQKYLLSQVDYNKQSSDPCKSTTNDPHIPHTSPRTRKLLITVDPKTYPAHKCGLPRFAGVLVACDIQPVLLDLFPGQNEVQFRKLQRRWSRLFVGQTLSHSFGPLRGSFAAVSRHCSRRSRHSLTTTIPAPILPFI